MRAVATVIISALLLAAGCGGETDPAPPERTAPKTPIPGEPVLAIPGQREAPPAPPAFAPKVGDAGVGGEERSE